MSTIYSVDRPFSCDICDDTFPWKDALTNHVLEKHENKEEIELDDESYFACDYCKKVFTTRMQLAEHLPVHDDRNAGEMTVCQFCDKTFKPLALKKHIKAVHASCKKPFVCDVCYKRFCSKRILAYHMNIHWREFPFACGTCDRRFRNAEEHEKHSLTHQDVVHTVNRPHFCKLCGERFLWKDQLDYHMMEHPSNGTSGSAANAFGNSERVSFSNQLLLYVCGKCKQAFPTKAGLKIHLRTHVKKAAKNSRKRSIHCKICGKRFVKRERLEKHTAEVHVKKEFSCGHCNKQFDTEESFKCHTDSHGDKNLFVCGICCDSFACAELLRIHLRVHRSKSYRCNICNCNFKTEPSLKKHIMRHTAGTKPVGSEDRDKETESEKPLCLSVQTCFLCGKCDEKFLKLEDLKRHMLSHDGGEKNDGVGKNVRLRRKDSKAVASKSKVMSSDSKAVSSDSATDDAKLLKCKKCLRCFKYKLSYTKHLALHERKKQ